MPGRTFPMPDADQRRRRGVFGHRSMTCLWPLGQRVLARVGSARRRVNPQGPICGPATQRATRGRRRCYERLHAHRRRAATIACTLASLFAPAGRRGGCLVYQRGERPRWRAAPNAFAAHRQHHKRRRVKRAVLTSPQPSPINGDPHVGHVLRIPRDRPESAVQSIDGFDGRLPSPVPRLATGSMAETAAARHCDSVARASNADVVERLQEGVSTSPSTGHPTTDDDHIERSGGVDRDLEAMNQSGASILHLRGLGLRSRTRAFVP